MKILFLLLMSFSLDAFSKDSNVVYRVRSVEADNGKVMVTFWENNRVFRIEKDSKFLPCLENGFKSKKKVVLKLNKKADVIRDCKLKGPPF